MFRILREERDDDLLVSPFYYTHEHAEDREFTWDKCKESSTRGDLFLISDTLGKGCNQSEIMM